MRRLPLPGLAGGAFGHLPAIALLKPQLLGFIIPVWLLIGGALPILPVALLLRPVYHKLEGDTPSKTQEEDM